MPATPMSQSDKRTVNALHALLTKRFPTAFPKDYDAIRPLKIGIHADLIQRLPEVDPCSYAGRWRITPTGTATGWP